MSVLDEVANKVKSVVGEKAPAAGLLPLVMELLNRPEIGGTKGLVKKFESAGLGAQIQSWIGGDKPLPITPDQVTRVFGNTEINQLATKANLPVADVATQLATLLPEAVKKFAPAVTIPGAEKVGEFVGSLKEKLTK